MGYSDPMPLGQAISLALGKKPSHGAVIRWETKAGFHYAAMFVPDKGGWYTTHKTGFVTSKQLLRSLEKSAVSIGVTDYFEEVDWP